MDGPGLRFGVFVQGCSHHCEGCHNPKSHEPNIGKYYSVDEIVERVCKNKLTQGVTLSGGEPFEQCEAEIMLASKLRKLGYDIWAYSGYTFETLMGGHPNKLAPLLVSLCDVLVDGPFVQKLASYDISWRGSTNQRLIDVQESLRQHAIVLFNTEEIEIETPPSW